MTPQTRSPLSTLAAAATLALASSFMLAAGTPALAQTRSLNSPATSIQSFEVQPLQRLRPGDDLRFALRATPGARVTLRIDGAANPLELTEVRPGVYEGAYTIRQTDRLSADSRVTAQVLKDGRAATASLGRSLQAGAPAMSRGSANAGNAGNAITGFQVQAPNRVRPGEELRFSLRGAPGGQARVDIEGANADVPLREVRRGVYEGRYVVRRQDRLRGELSAVAYLVNDGRESTQRYAAGTASDERRAKAQACATCGTVESVQRVEVKDGSSNVIGTIAGGVLGGVIGNQVGGGSGRELARVIGAVGGAYAGNRVQNNMNKNEVWRVTVRLQGGSTRDFDYAQDPEVAVGTRVKVEGEQLVRQ
jgi:outer membrane lipoprotein SlyB